MQALLSACSFAYSLNLMRVVRPVAVAARGSLTLLSRGIKENHTAEFFIEHILPQIMPSVIINVSLAAATSMLAESGLTYLGVGVPSHIASWGRSLASAVSYVTVHPSVTIWPGLLITLAVLSVNLLGDALRSK